MPLVELLTPELAAAAAVAVVASFISGFAGFGLNLVMTPILALLFSPIEAIPVITVLGLVNVVRMLGGTWRHMDKREVVIMGLTLICAVIYEIKKRREEAIIDASKRRAAMKRSKDTEAAARQAAAAA